MAQLETSVPIAASAKLIFAFFVPQRMPYWYGAEMEACFEMQGGAADFGVAHKVHVTGHLGRREVSHTVVVTAFEYARLFEWRFEDRYGVKGLERWELDPAPPDAASSTSLSPLTIVRMRSSYVLPGVFGKVFDRLVTRHAVVRRNREYLERLKRLVEHSASGKTGMPE